MKLDFIQNLTDLIDQIPNSSAGKELTILQGTNYGFTYSGYIDQPLILLDSILKMIDQEENANKIVTSENLVEFLESLQFC